MAPKMSDFERYLIERIDDLETKLHRVDSKITWVYAFSAGVSTVVGIITSLLSNHK